VPDRPPEADALGVVLAGGRSARMGVDKATLEFEGCPLVTYALDILRGAGLPVVIAGNRADLKNFAPAIDDLGSGRGPLDGICGVLQVTSVPIGVFVSVDLPLLPASLLSLMQNVAYVTGDAIVLSSVNGFAQTFPAVLNRVALPALRAELEAGRYGCFAAFRAAAASLGQRVHVVAVEPLVQAGQLEHQDELPAARWFFNINSAGDLERARFLRQSSHPANSRFA
jgi:molybdopterin-guanine dinucleotide biosynthesis protein A